MFPKLAPILFLLTMPLQAMPLQAMPLQAVDVQRERDAARALVLPAVGDDDLGEWRARIRPAGDEVAFEDIPWIASFAEGVRVAEREQKPLLFWAMNGHPLGCT